MSHVLCNFKFLHLSKSNDPLFAIFYISLKIVLNIWRFPPESTSDARSTNLINLIVYDERETKVFFLLFFLPMGADSWLEVLGQCGMTHLLAAGGR